MLPSTTLLARPSEPLLRAAEADCRRLARNHYENFLVGSLFLPRNIRQDFFNVYAYCRIADDFADESPNPYKARTALKGWRRAFLACVDPTVAADALPDRRLVALRKTIAAHQLPTQPFLDLIDAFEQDQEVTRYTTFEQLQSYCRRSANPVGRLVLRLAGCDDPPLDRLSDAICTGLQLANFWQDVARDFAKGRIYLPREDLDRFQVTENDLAVPTTSPQVRQLIAFEVARTESFFESGESLVDRVPRWLARDLRLFIGGGRATLQAIRRCDFDVLRKRPRVTKWTQLKLMLQVWGKGRS